MKMHSDLRKYSWPYKKNPGGNSTQNKTSHRKGLGKLLSGCWLTSKVVLFEELGEKRLYSASTAAPLMCRRLFPANIKDSS